MKDRPSSPGISVLTPPRVFFVLLIGGIVADFLLPTPAPFFLVPWLFRLSAGLAVAALGFLFMMWGHNRFIAAGTTVKTRLPASELVIGGAYRLSRNPMYVGFVAILLGIGIAANGSATMAAALLMYVYLGRFVIPREERYLRHRFGTDYDAYCGKVRRWL